MNLYTNAKIITSEKNQFDDKDGKSVEYYVNYIKSDEGGVLAVNSSKDFSASEGQEGLVCIRTREREGGGTKLSLIEFHKDMEISTPEKEID